MKLFAPHQKDFYKADHRSQYPKGTEVIYSNFTARSGKHSNVENSKGILFVGLQLFIIDYLINEWNDSFFSKPKEKVVGKYKERISNALNKDFDVAHIEALHDLGYLPVVIKALPEGSFVPYKVPVLTIKNTIPEFYWVTNMLESVLSCELWPLITTATTYREYLKTFNEYAELTGSEKSFVPFQAHDFSYRGMFGREAAAKSGLAGLLAGSMGTDCIPAIDLAEEYYPNQEEFKDEFIAGSVSATEHSVMSSNIELLVNSNISRSDAELQVFKELITETYPDGIVSIVSDTFDFWNVVTEILPKLRKEIISRNGKLTIRPDCYDEETQILTSNGWKFFKSLTDTDKVAQVLDDGSYEFITPQKITKQNYSGEMHKFKDHHGKVDLLVTPDHRMVINVSGKDKIIYAKDIKKLYHYHKLYRSASAKNNHKELSNLDRLRIAFQADGSYCTKSNSSIRFSFKKQRKIDRLEKILQEENLQYKIYNLSDSRVEFNIKIDASKMQKDFSWIDISNLDKTWCVNFMEELSHWDSSIRNDGRFKFSSTNKEVIDVVEYIGVSAGYGVYTSKYIDNRKEIFSDVYEVHVMKNNIVGGRSIVHTIQNYDGNVYCVTVPSGKILVKRNQSILVCGNSGSPVKIICGDLEFTDYDSTDSNLPKFKSLKQIEEYLVEEEFSVEDGYRSNSDDSSESKTDIHYFRFKDTYYKFEQVSNYSCNYDPYDGGFCYLKNTSHTLEVYNRTPQEKGLVECLWEIFGGTYNSKHYKVLNEKIGAIYGDSITLSIQKKILEKLKSKGFASSNVVLGVGSFSLTYVTRDSHGFAMKATSATINGNQIDIYKDPKTDDGTKKSAKGLLMVTNINGSFELMDQVTPKEEARGCLEKVFENGKLLKKYSLMEVRNLVKSGIDK